MKKFSFATLAFVLILTGAGCADNNSNSDTSVTSEDAPAAEGVSIHSIGQLVNDMYYSEIRDQTDGYKDFIFEEQSGTCADADLSPLRYVYEESADAPQGYAPIQEEKAMVGLRTSGENAMDWYFFDVEGGQVKCSYVIDAETFDVVCEQGGEEYCSGTFTGVAYK